MSDSCPEWKIWAIQASRSELDDWLILIIRQLANRMDDGDLMRLADLLEAVIKGWVASKLGPDLPSKPGMASAYAISTIFSGRWVQQMDGTWRSHKPLAKWGYEHDPVEAGKTWRKRLLREVRFNKEKGISDDRSELIGLILQHIDARKKHRSDPQTSAPLALNRTSSQQHEDIQCNPRMPRAPGRP